MKCSYFTGISEVILVKPLSKYEIRTSTVQDIRVAELFIAVVNSAMVGSSRHRLELACIPSFFNYAFMFLSMVVIKILLAYLFGTKKHFLCSSRRIRPFFEPLLLLLLFFFLSPEC
jgi:hypothetical protein